MSQPRVTITYGKSGEVERRSVISTEMYSDRLSVAGSNRKWSIKDRLGGNIDHTFAGRQTLGKRQRQDDGKWKHDMYDDDDGSEHELRSRQNGSEDLRYTLTRIRREQSGNGSTGGGVKDLREKLSGPIPSPAPPQSDDMRRSSDDLRRKDDIRRRLSSVVRGNSAPAPAPVSTQAPAPPVVTRPPAASRSIPAPKPQAVEEQTVATILHSLGLSKYLITFQAEEVDMAALRHMGDEDLKELGIPMGPRKKILLALNAR